MNQRERFFNVLRGQEVDYAPFFPDISTWYENTRKPFGEEEIFPPGSFIPDDHPFQKRTSRLQGPLANFTCIDFYREYGWGLPVHIYDWLLTTYDDSVEVREKRADKTRQVSYETKAGILYRTWMMDHDGSWAPKDMLIKNWEKDVPVLKYLLAHTHYSADFAKAEKFLRETEGFGVCDLVFWRSPFGKLVHEYLGFEDVIYTLADRGDDVEELLSFVEEYDLKIIELAASGPCNLVIISDHADENLISPAQYQQYCIPFYLKANGMLHDKGKNVSTHLDGNIKHFLPILHKTNFDLLDGCTPAPMFNYTVEELAGAPNRPACYLGVPAVLFVNDTSVDGVCDFGRRISEAFKQNVIINVGDILPPNGSIDKVIALGQSLARCAGKV
jgi:hypothetical protein